MGKISGTIILCILLVGCQTALRDIPSWNPQPRDILLRTMTQAALEWDYKRRGGKKENVKGFYEIGSEPCKIYVSVDYLDTWILQHEARHCDDPKFH